MWPSITMLLREHVMCTPILMGWEPILAASDTAFAQILQVRNRSLNITNSFEPFFTGFLIRYYDQVDSLY